MAAVEASCHDHFAWFVGVAVVVGGVYVEVGLFEIMEVEADEDFIAPVPGAVVCGPATEHPLLLIDGDMLDCIAGLGGNRIGAARDSQ